MNYMTTHLRHSVAAFAVAILCAGTQAASAETLRFLVPWNESSEGNMVIADLWTDILAEESAGAFTLQRFNTAVVPPFEQFEPVASGVFDMHYTTPAYHSGATVIGQIVDTATADPELRRTSGLWNLIDEGYQKRGVKPIAIAVSTGFQFMLREPIGPSGNLAGLNIRSNPAYDGTIRALDGAPNNLPITEVYGALQRSMIDGTAFPLHGMEASKMYEVISYMVRPSFGQATELVLMNLDKWNSLTPEQQEILLRAGERFEREIHAAITEVARRDEAAMLERGVQFTELGADYAGRIRQIYNDATWERAIANGGEEAQMLVDFVKSNDLLYTGPLGE